MHDSTESLVFQSREVDESDSQPPVVVVLHSRGSDEQELEGVGELFDDDVAVLYVRAPDADGKGFRWYDTDLSAGTHDLSQPQSGDLRRSLNQLHDFVSRAVDRADLDGNRVGLFGYSQGAIVSLAALVDRPTAYSWVVALNGYLPSSQTDPGLIARAAGTPVLVSGGRKDETIPPWRVQRAGAMLSGGDVDVTLELRDEGHEWSPETLADAVAWATEAT